jgi:hypothetical protein
MLSRLSALICTALYFSAPFSSSLTYAQAAEPGEIRPHRYMCMDTPFVGVKYKGVISAGSEIFIYDCNLFTAPLNCTLRWPLDGAKIASYAAGTQNRTSAPLGEGCGPIPPGQTY